MKGTGKNNPRQGQGQRKPRTQHAKVGQAEEEREQAEDALRFQGEIITNMSEGVNLIRASDKKIIYANPRFEEMFGYEPGELIGKNVVILNEETPEKTAQEVADDIEKAVIEKGEFVLEILNRRKDGTPFWCLAHVSTYQHPEYGSVYISVHEDITERKQAEDLLRESEERYHSLFENMLDGFAYCRMLFENDLPQDFIYLNVNEAFEQLTGLKNVIGKKVTEVIPGIRESNPEIFEIYGRVALTGKPERFETYIESLDIWLSISVYSTKKDYFVAAFDNITERKRAEEMLRQRAEELAALQATVLEITTPHDLPNVLQTIVERAAQLLNATSGGLYLCDPERQEARCLVSYNTPRDYTGTVLKYGQGAAGTVAQTGKPLIIDDYCTWGGRANAFEKEQPFSAVLSVPMIWHGQVTGVIHVLHNVETRRFTEADLELLTLFANHAAIATENARLFQGLQLELTERKRAEDALRRSESSLQAVLQSTADGILAVGSENEVLYANEHFAKMWLIPQAIITSKDDSILLQYVLDQLIDPQSFLKKVQQLYKSKEESFDTLHFKDGRVFERLSRPLMQKAELRGRVWSFRDITERKRAEAVLRESEERFRSILDNIEDGYYEVDTAGNLTFFNPAQVRMLGRPANELMGMNNRLYMTPEGAKAVFQTFNRVFRTGIPEQAFNWEFVRPDGTRRSVEASVSLIKAADGSINGFRGTVRDITERKRAEEQIRRRNIELAAVNRIGQAFSRLRPPSEIVELLYTHIGQVLDNRNLYIALCDEAHQTLSFPVYAINGERHTPASRPFGNGLTEYVIRTGAPLLIPRNQPAFLAEQGIDLIGTPSKCFLAAPMRVGERVTGVIAVQDYENEDIYDANHVELIDTLAAQAAIALENARLYSAVQQELDERKRAEEQIQRQVETLGVLYDLSRTLSGMEDFNAILDLVTRRAVEATHVTFARVLLLEQDDLVARAVFPVRVLDHDLQVGQREPLAAHPFCQRVLEGNAPLVLQSDSPEADECAPFFLGVAQTLYIVPLHVHEHPFGLLMLGEGRDAAREPVTADKIRLTRSIGDQAASTLHRALLHEETEKQVQRLASLREIDMAISSSFDLRVTLNIVLNHILTQLKVDAADVLLLSPLLQSLDYIAGHGFRTPGITRSHLRLGEEFAGKAALEHRLLHIPDLTQESGFVRLPLLAGENFIGYYAVPLVAKGQVKGVLEVFHRAPLPVTVEWTRFLESLTGQAAIAIDNVQLFDGLQRSNAELVLAYDTTLEGWAKALELRDKETEGHTQRVTELTLRLARAMGVRDAEMVHLRHGALLHDIGKMGVPDDILRKPGPLTDEEWVIMRQHPQFAFEMLSPIAYLRQALDIPSGHHEKWDGSGYPRGLKGEQIPLAARIFAVVDVWDALLSDRPYRKAWSQDRTTKYIREQAGKHFDPKVVEAFFINR